jgi:hypothetical protein
MVRYPRLGGRRSTGKVLDASILRCLLSYRPSSSESAKFPRVPRNSVADRETSLRPISTGNEASQPTCQFLPALSGGQPLISSRPTVTFPPLAAFPDPAIYSPPLVCVRPYFPGEMFRLRRRCGIGSEPRQRDFSTPCGQVCGQDIEQEAGHFRWQNQTRPPWSGRRSISRFVAE